MLDFFSRVRSLLRREFSSKSHEKAWANFEQLLMYRTKGAFIMRVLIDYTFFFLGDSRVQNSEKYVLEGADQETFPYNKDFTDATFTYFKYLYIVMSFGRVIILFLSIKYQKVTKVIGYYLLAMEFIFELGLPIN